MNGERGARLDGLRVVFFGMGGVFSREPLEALLRAGVDLRAVVSPAPEDLTGAEPFIRLEPSAYAAGRGARRALPLAGAVAPARSLAEIAASRGAPLYSVRRLNDARTLEALAAHAPDALCVACFTRRLPVKILRLARLGALNAHPSLLPEHRGPDPLFWTFHTGARETGVTVHLMDTSFDTGPILAREQTPLAEGETEAALEGRLARLAGALMVRALTDLAAGTLTPQPQDERHASYESWPERTDYTIPATWEARRAWVFARGVMARGEPITLTAHDGTRFRMIAPLGYDAAETLRHPWRLTGDQLELACAPGIFTCRAEPLGERAGA